MSLECFMQIAYILQPKIKHLNLVEMKIQMLFQQVVNTFIIFSSLLTFESNTDFPFTYILYINESLNTSNKIINTIKPRIRKPKLIADYIIILNTILIHF